MKWNEVRTLVNLVDRATHTIRHIGVNDIGIAISLVDIPVVLLVMRGTVKRYRQEVRWAKQFNRPERIISTYCFFKSNDSTYELVSNDAPIEVILMSQPDIEGKVTYVIACENAYLHRFTSHREIDRDPNLIEIINIEHI